jgi:glutamate-1-semialdehyde 2,1-aminomutase
MHCKSKSQAIYEKLCEVIPGGVNSPARACTGMGQNPLIVESGAKDCIYDVDGKRFVDYCCSWGALIHGHCHPEIMKEVRKRMAMGTSFGISTSVEEKLARRITQHMTSIEKIRFVSSGTEATMSAVRLARGFTGRDLIVKFNGNYHGHADYFLVQAGSGLSGLPSSSSAGIPKSVVSDMASLPYNDVETCRQFLRTHPVAAVIVEPIAGNMGVVPATHEFLQMLRAETENSGALLILDEVMTGFRVGIGGAQMLYNIKPDLTCLGKIVGGGFPLAAFGGREDIMNHLAPLGPVYQAGTLSGNPIAAEAGLQAIIQLERTGFYVELQKKADLITLPVKAYIEKNNINACVQQVGSMFTLFFGAKSVNNGDEAKNLDSDLFAKFFRHMFSQGIYIPPSQQEAWFVSAVHEKGHLEQTRDVILNFLKN